MDNIFSLLDKVAIVTGGYGYLGTDMSKGLANAGAKVIVAGRSQEKYEEKFQDSIGIDFESCDIMDSKSLSSLFDRVASKFGKIDILVNNATSVKTNKPVNISDEDWCYTMEGVLGSVFKGIREVVPYMLKNGQGKIVNISSMYGVVSPDFSLYDGENCEFYINPPHYGAAKAGVVQLTKYYASLLGKNNIQVNSISPGPFPSNTIQERNIVFINRLKAKTSVSRVGQPKDLVGAVTFFSSQASNFITGQNLLVDGGWTIT